MARPELHETSSRGRARRWVYCGGLVATAAALLLLGTAVIPSVIPGSAWAETHEDGDHGGGSGRGNGGSHEDGHDDSPHDDAEGGHDEGGKGGRGGSGGGGHEDGAGREGEGTGPQPGGEGNWKGHGQSAGAAGAGRPVWAQEGIPEVELGRLNVARSPKQVLDRAYAEAIGALTPKVAAFYALSLEQMETTLRQDWDTLQIIDSPLQNLALMRDALGGTSVLVSSGISGDNDALLAVFLGTASDKGVPITTETALAVSMILGQPLSEDEAERLAADAERIRQAIVEGHG